MRQLLASDFDRTLLCNNSVSKDDLEMIAKFRRKGNLFGIITGRSISMIDYDLEYHQVPFDFLVCNNGGVICDSELNILLRHDIPLDIVKEMLDIFSENGEMMVGISDGDAYGIVLSAEVEVNAEFVPPLRTKNVPAEEILKKGQVNSIIVREKTEALTMKLKETIGQKYAQKITAHFNNGTLDINAIGVSKKNAVYQLGEYYNIENLQVIGDGYNDLEMITEFKGFAMTDAVPVVKDNAGFIVDSVAECLNYLLEEEYE